MDAKERSGLIRRYEEGPAKLRAALDRAPEESRKWRPGAGKWSIHEIVCHCADSETNGAMRVRYVTAEKNTVVQGYDQDEWARHFDYHNHPIELALATVESVRANTAALLSRLPEADWEKGSRHSESGTYRATDWLKIYAEHLEKHSGQIDRTLEAWKKSR